ncbi:uncharacterized protein LOC132311528 [Cornus florida]|uniref:uncharacterized protein LOC132311528 n=1 Tax=Cornus florida TaxID=4283 RepID=UPI00289A895C|nr:uncharacterized protein LOC132311528 [Cornus florida]
MDEFEFQRLLNLFPVVRPRDYHIDLDSSRQSTSQSSKTDAAKEWQDAWNDGNRKESEIEQMDKHDAFWEKLKLAAEKKVGTAGAERFCKAFQQVHKKLVYEELSLDAARSIINSEKSSG